MCSDGPMVTSIYRCSGGLRVTSLYMCSDVLRVTLLYMCSEVLNVTSLYKCSDVLRVTLLYMCSDGRMEMWEFLTYTIRTYVLEVTRVCMFSERYKLPNLFSVK